MKIGVVTGAVRSSRTAPCLQGQNFVVVNTGEGEIVAGDYVGAENGDTVLLITGEPASRLCMEAPVDAAVIAILEK